MTIGQSHEHARTGECRVSRVHLIRNDRNTYERDAHGTLPFGTFRGPRDRGGLLSRHRRLLRPETGRRRHRRSLLPQLGNGGFDARHYDLDVAYNPDTDRLDGRTTLTARATQNLSSFDLDLQKLEVTKVEVNGRRAGFTRTGDEIRITPRGTLSKGRTFTVTVTYGVSPKPSTAP